MNASRIAARPTGLLHAALPLEDVLLEPHEETVGTRPDDGGPAARRAERRAGP